MNCAICRHGVTSLGKVVVTLVRNSTTVVFKDVPADVCENCGEEYIDRQVSESLLRAAEEAVHSGVEIDVRQYLAA
ncbi:MAG: type II toxin-antitoxin system MqsA family antitoxin [Bacteroidota bacterium]